MIDKEKCLQFEEKEPDQDESLDAYEREIKLRKKPSQKIL